jgi:hypothetical protein
LCQIAPENLEEIAHFIARQSSVQPDLASPQIAARLRWIVLDNPARKPNMPFGWCVRNELNEIVGCMCCAPQRFVFRRQTSTLMMATSFYVDEQYRGAGTSIFVKFLQLGREYGLFVSSANPAVAQMWQRLGAFPIGNSDHEMVGILRWRGTIEEAMVRKLGNNALAGLVAKIASPLASRTQRLRMGGGQGELLPLKSPEEAASLCESAFNESFTAVRDAACLRWRYFSEVDPTTRLFAFNPKGSDQRFLIAVNQRRRGYRQQIVALHVLDVFGPSEPDSYATITKLLVHEYHRQIDVVVFRCLDPAGQQALRRIGFVRRPFAAPIAWCRDKFEFVPSKNWYFVPADGDMLL